MNRQKELILAALKNVKNSLKYGIKSKEIDLKGFTDDEISLVYQQLFEDELINASDLSNDNDKYKKLIIFSLTGSGEMRLIELEDEKKSQTVLGWLKKNWFPFLTLLITSGINLFKLINELAK